MSSHVDSLVAMFPEVDVDTLQNHLENLTFGRLDDDDLRVYTDESFLKLFRLGSLNMTPHGIIARGSSPCFLYMRLGWACAGCVW